MLLAAAAEAPINLAESFIVGDRWRDIEAGRGAGVRTVFVDRGYGEKLPNSADLVVNSLIEAVSLIIGMQVGEER